MLVRLDRQLVSILWLSLWVSTLAVAISMLLGVPAGVFLGLRRFWGRSLIVTLVKDRRAPSGWIFGNFQYNGALGPAQFENLVPVGLMWGEDPDITTDY